MPVSAGFRGTKNPDFSYSQSYEKATFPHMTKRDKQMREYASEELRDGAVATRETVRLTDAERAALATAADLLIGSKPGATLRKLLERTK